MLHDGSAHLVDPRGQFAQLVLTLHGDRVIQIAARQDIQFFFQLLDIPQLAVDKAHKAQRKDSKGQQTRDADHPEIEGVAGKIVEKGLRFRAVCKGQGIFPLRVFFQRIKIIRVKGLIPDHRGFVDQRSIPINREINALSPAAPGVETGKPVSGDGFSLYISLQLLKLAV